MSYYSVVISTLTIVHYPIYIYIYIEREREREREKKGWLTNMLNLLLFST